VTGPALVGYALLAAALLLVAAGERISNRHAAIPACDDCPGRPGCPCANGHTDPTDCTCPTEDPRGNQ
jgi:hypothetical protein